MYFVLFQEVLCCQENYMDGLIKSLLSLF